MDVKGSLAGKLYGAALDAAQNKPAQNAQTQTQPGKGGDGFGATLEKSALDTLRAVRGAEETVKSGLAGRADAHSVVEALAQTELAVETATTVRDKVVEAYNEILRMPV